TSEPAGLSPGRPDIPAVTQPTHDDHRGLSKRARVIGAAAVAAMALIVALVLISRHGSANPGYLAQDPGDVTFVQWTRTGDSLTGTITISVEDPSSGTVQSQDLPFTGTISGSSVTLTLE